MTARTDFTPASPPVDKNGFVHWMYEVTYGAALMGELGDDYTPAQLKKGIAHTINLVKAKMKEPR